MTGTKEYPKKRLLIFLNRLVIGGPAVDLISIAGFLHYDYDILFIHGEKETHEVEATYLLNNYPHLQVKKIPSLRRSVNPFLDIVSLWVMLRIMYQFKPHIVHTHGAKSGFIGRVVAFLCRVPVIVHTFHGHVFHSYYSPFKTRLIILLERLLAKLSTHIIALSPHQKVELSSYYGIAAADKISIIPLGINQAYFQENIEEKKERFNALFPSSIGAIKIGIISRIVPIKNHQLFLDAALRLLHQPKYQHLHFFIVGNGDMRPQLAQYVQDNEALIDTAAGQKSPSHFHFTDWIQDIAMVHHSLDIIVLTSFNEGTPLSLIEAQFCGKPVIATNVGGVKDVVVDGETGYLINSNDVDALVQKLALLADDAALRKIIGQKAHQFTEKHFSLQAQVDRTKLFYKTALNKN